jgi:predicted nucleic acid-binding protein
MIVVADSTPLIALARIERLSLLRELFGEVLIPPAVMREVVEEGQRPGALEVSTASWIRVHPIKASSRMFTRALDLGEMEAIVLALELSGSILLIDEIPGRREATTCGLKVIGTVGVLIRAKSKGLITILRPELDKLLAHGFHISDEIRQIALNAAGEVT